MYVHSYTLNISQNNTSQLRVEYERGQNQTSQSISDITNKTKIIKNKRIKYNEMYIAKIVTIH
jgi:hypothetical protein